MKKAIYILFVIAFIACSQSPGEKLEHLNGYWEIAAVENAIGERKEFTVSQNIDFIQIENGKGIRKKVQPDVLGNFKTSAATENIDIEINDDILTLKYTTPYDSWIETVKKATPNELVVVNTNGSTYTYRRYTPLISK